jgi:hypothetical protein
MNHTVNGVEFTSGKSPGMTPRFKKNCAHCGQPLTIDINSFAQIDAGLLEFVTKQFLEMESRCENQHLPPEKEETETT